ncbi:hypothetical protein HWV23_16275 [Natronomonas halophila]|uniref:hypothetical protein n=1 Tax=Natronomonas halophila TaxID=2747817 RepID=UPI0015B598D3|nr:hypothetical protein [Natronomonas halophila]QLD87212.1 hypothetical protein HWV23_16275 [Natronomonas halophila]
MTPDADRRCSRCGGEAVRKSGDGVPVLECADCGNVLGLARSGSDAAPDADSTSAESTEETSVSTGTVHATDGDLGQLERLLRARGDDEGRLEADRLVLETETATLEVLPDGDTLEIRPLDED